MNRRQKKKEKTFECEARWQFKSIEVNVWVEKDTLIKLGYIIGSFEENRSVCGLNCCCKQQRRRDVTWFKLCLILILRWCQFGAARVCLEAARVCQKAARVCSEAARVCPEAARVCPEAARVCPKAARVCPKAARVCPKAARVCPEAARVCPKAARVCLKAARVCQKAARVCQKAARVCQEAARVCPQSWWCRQVVGGTVQSAGFYDCVLLGLCMRGSSSIVR